MLRKVSIMDADTHVIEPADLWEKYMPAKFHDRAPRVVDSGTRQEWTFDGSRVAITTLTNVTGTSPVNWTAIDPAGYRAMRPGGWDPAARLEDMNVDMIDSQVLFPSFALVMTRVLLGAKGGLDREYHVAYVRAYNDWMSAFCSNDPKRFVGLAMVPVTGIDDAIAEVERACKLPAIRGVVIQCWPNGAGVTKKEDERFWSLLEDLGVPCNVHVGLEEPGKSDPDLPTDPELMEKLLSMPAINGERTARSILPILSEFVLGGILDRHPRLTLGIVETGIGWIPFFFEQTDDNFLRHRFWTKCKLSLLPSQYWLRQCFATFQIDNYGLRNRDLLGVHTICWSSDYPHTGVDWPNSQRTIMDQMRGIPEAEQQLILGGNMRRIYGMA
jgi:predicted TIM-barrel fold metal-dependent hydrolase